MDATEELQRRQREIEERQKLHFQKTEAVLAASEEIQKKMRAALDQQKSLFDSIGITLGERNPFVKCLHDRFQVIDEFAEKSRRAEIKYCDIMEYMSSEKLEIALTQAEMNARQAKSGDAISKIYKDITQKAKQQTGLPKSSPKVAPKAEKPQPFAEDQKQLPGFPGAPAAPVASQTTPVPVNNIMKDLDDFMSKMESFLDATISPILKENVLNVDEKSEEDTTVLPKTEPEKVAKKTIIEKSKIPFKPRKSVKRNVIKEDKENPSQLVIDNIDNSLSEARKRDQKRKKQREATLLTSPLILDERHISCKEDSETSTEDTKVGKVVGMHAIVPSMRGRYLLSQQEQAEKQVPQDDEETIETLLAQFNEPQRQEASFPHLSHADFPTSGYKKVALEDGTKTSETSGETAPTNTIRSIGFGRRLRI